VGSRGTTRNLTSGCGLGENFLHAVENAAGEFFRPRAESRGQFFFGRFALFARLPVPAAAQTQKMRKLC
jgi:hypothetical protein